jgi:hypothetical protein
MPYDDIKSCDLRRMVGKKAVLKRIRNVENLITKDAYFLSHGLRYIKEYSTNLRQLIVEGGAICWSGIVGLPPSLQVLSIER